MKNTVCVYVKDSLILGTENYREVLHLPNIQRGTGKSKGMGDNSWMFGAVLHVAGYVTSHDLPLSATSILIIARAKNKTKQNKTKNKEIGRAHV